ncbi:MAG TPA: hypothetical protein VNN74_03500 [Candidatus Micrarchaeia archaeon]|nr:hypothetical protein [Candidatus Micrarchaeia archaeon]
MATLCNDVTIHVAVHDQPLAGRVTAAFLFEVLTQELTRLVVVEEIAEGPKSVVVFETSPRAEHACGLNVVAHGADGLVRDLTVFFRPLASLRALADVIGARMAERSGPPPEGSAEMERILVVGRLG